MIQPPSHLRAPESFMIFGKTGTGKSTIWDSIAATYRRTETPGRFYVISTEPERAFVTVENHPDWEDNITILEPAPNYAGLIASSEIALSAGKREDWIIVDSAPACLEWVRDAWFERPENFGKGWRSFQAEGHNIKEVAAHQWQNMNAVYRDWVNRYVFNFPGNRMLIEQADSIPEGPWGNPYRDTYGHIGYRPMGFKLDDYYVHTNLFASRTRTGEYTLKTIKDRVGRPYMDELPMAALEMGGFALTYLQGIAGWTVT